MRQPSDGVRLAVDVYRPDIEGEKFPAILAYGMTLVILIGGIDLSVGALVALVGTVTVALMAQVSGGEYDGAFADPEGRSREGLLLLKVECQTFLA